MSKVGRLLTLYYMLLIGVALIARNSVGSHLEWQLPVSPEDGHQLNIEIFQKSSKEHGVSGDVLVTVVANLGQNFIVCGDIDEVDQSVSIFQEQPETGAFIRPNCTKKLTTNFYKSQFYISSPRQVAYLPNYKYQAQGLLHSDKDFMVFFQPSETKSKKDNESPLDIKQGSLGYIGIADRKPDTPLIFSDSDYGFDDDNELGRRPPWMPFQTSHDYSLTILPNLKLPDTLGDYLPDLGTWYYLLDFLSFTGDKTIILHSVTGHDQQPVSFPIDIKTYEWRDMKNYLTSARKLVSWLAPKLNGREAIIQQLLNLQAMVVDDSRSDEYIQKLMQEQIAELLATKDRSFNLELHVYLLEKTLWNAAKHHYSNSVSGIIQTADNHPQSQVSIWSGGAQARRNTGSASSNAQNLESGDANNGHIRPATSASATPSSQRSALPPLRLVFLGRQNLGKSTLANEIIGWDYFKEHYLESYGTVDATYGEPPYLTDHLEIISTAGIDGKKFKESSYAEEQKTAIRNSSPNTIFIYLLPEIDRIGKKDKAYFDLLSGKKVIYVVNKSAAHIGGYLASTQREITQENIKEAKLELKRGYLEKDHRIDPNRLIFTECLSENDFDISPQELISQIEGFLTQPEEKEAWEHYLGTRLYHAKISESFVEKVREIILKVSSPISANEYIDRLKYGFGIDETQHREIVESYLQKPILDAVLRELYQRRESLLGIKLEDLHRFTLMYTEVIDKEWNELSIGSALLRRAISSTGGGVGGGIRGGIGGGILGGIIGGLVGLFGGPAGVLSGAALGAKVAASISAVTGALQGGQKSTILGSLLIITAAKFNSDKHLSDEQMEAALPFVYLTAETHQLIDRKNQKFADNQRFSLEKKRKEWVREMERKHGLSQEAGARPNS